MRRGKNLFCAGVALALCLGLTACGVQTSTEPSVAPYDMTEEQEDLLSLLGMTDRAMVFSFQGPEEATQLTAHTYVLEDGAWVENLPKEFKDFSSVTLVGDLTVYFCACLVLVVVVHLLLSRTRRGRYFTAVGDNAGGATLVGISAVRTKVLAYVICGVMAALAGILFCSRIGFVTSLSGNGYEMKAVAACVLGGISLSGGVGSVVGAAIGAVIMSSISYLLVFMGFSSNYDNTITGVILITIVVADALMQRRAAVRNRHERLAARTAGTVEGGDAK